MNNIDPWSAFSWSLLGCMFIPYLDLPWIELYLAENNFLQVQQSSSDIEVTSSSGYRWVMKRKHKKMKLLKLSAKHPVWTRESFHPCQGELLLHILGMILKLVFMQKMIVFDVCIWFTFKKSCEINYALKKCCLQGLELPTFSML